jgi:GH25 family lysozyme M1 (1,4-beta-N-acetylmuramidase)
MCGQLDHCLVQLTSRGTLPGIDVSSYQGSVNWAAVAQSGQVFAITKATEGTTYTDEYLAANFAGMAANGMVVSCVGGTEKWLPPPL